MSRPPTADGRPRERPLTADRRPLSADSRWLTVDCTVIAKLLARAGLRGDFRLHPLPGGANNRVFRVELGGSKVLLKAYFQHPEDPRDRLGAEFAFSRFAWEHGVRCLPRPLACDPEHRLGLYEFVEGRPLRPGEVTEGMVQQALAFYRALNRHRELPEAMALPRASEACFSLDAHLRCVERRVERLCGVTGATEIEREAADFIHTELVPAWRRVADSVRRKAVEIGLPLEDELPREARCLSPSDFGFHNALLDGDRRLRFIDFEYAGWDDPAKLVCDFFCQPAVPVPREYYTAFVASVVSELPEPEMQRWRIALLFPVYQIKWCCILLNDFLPVGSQRRRFARGALEQKQRKAEQLWKARRVLLEIGD